MGRGAEPHDALVGIGLLADRQRLPRGAAGAPADPFEQPDGLEKAEGARLGRGIGKLDFLVKLRIWPFCDAIATLKRFQSPEGPRTPVLSLASADGQAHVGSPLRVDVRTPPFDSYVYVDYFTAKGEVVHLLPNDKDAVYLRPARNNFVLGRFPMAGCWPLAGDPGQGLITLVASSDRLFPTPRPPAENAKDYLPALARLLTGAKAEPIATTVLMFNLRPGDTAAAERCPAG